MNLSDLTSSGDKPWLAINAASIDCTLGTGVKTGIVNFENLPISLTPLPGNTILFTDSTDVGRPTINNGLVTEKLAYKNEIPGQSLLASDIIFMQGAISFENVVGTWAEVEDYIVAKNGLVNVYIDDSIVSPCVVSSSVNCENRTQFFGSANAGTAPKLLISNGFALTDPKSFNTLELQLSSPALPTIILSNGSILSFTEGATLRSIDSTVPNISYPNGASIVLSFGVGGNVNNGGNVMLKLGVGSTMILTVLENAAGVVMNNLFSSVDGSSSIILGYDDTFDIVNFNNPAFLGTLTPDPISISKSVKYDDSLTPQLGSSQVQGALDGVKQRLTFNGFQAINSATVGIIPTASTTSICDTLQLGSNYNVGTFTYTIPVNGLYELYYNLGWLWTSTVNPANGRLDTAFKIVSGGTSFPGYKINEIYATAATSQTFRGINSAMIYSQLNSGDTVQITAANNSSANNMTIDTSSYFSARLIQAT